MATKGQRADWTLNGEMYQFDSGPKHPKAHLHMGEFAVTPHRNSSYINKASGKECKIGLILELIGLKMVRNEYISDKSLLESPIKVYSLIPAYDFF